MTFSFDDLEASNYGGQPVLLYEFLRSSGGTNYYWRYCSANVDFEYLGNTFVATAISDAGITQSGEAVATVFTVTMPITESFPQMFRTAGSVPSDQVWLTVFRAHFGNPDDGRVVWKGTVASMSQVDNIKVQLSCNVLTASFKRPGLRLAWSRTCPHVLYDSQCQKNREDLRISAVVSAIDGIDVQAAEFASQPDGWWSGGFIEWAVSDSGFIERRWIKNHVGDVIALSGSTFGMAVGDTINVFAGCDHLLTTCSVKHNNLTHNGGFSNMPGKSPFSGDPVF